MPVRAVTTRFMYKGLCTIPDVLTYRTPVNLPEDEVEGEACCFLLSVCLLALSVVPTSDSNDNSCNSRI